VTAVYLVRHGESVANVERVFSNGRVDLPLTERGRAQAQRLAAWLAAPPGDGSGAPGAEGHPNASGAAPAGGAGRGLAHAYSAPLRRAQETAGIVATHLGLPCTVLADLDEVRVGDLDGRRDAAAWALYDAVVARWRAGDETAAFPGGETFRQASQRFAGALREIARRHPGATPAGRPWP
jgi:probable phosphoglycerate mutase